MSTPTGEKPRYHFDTPSIEHFKKHEINNTASINSETTLVDVINNVSAPVGISIDKAVSCSKHSLKNNTSTNASIDKSATGFKLINKSITYTVTAPVTIPICSVGVTYHLFLELKKNAVWEKDEIGIKRITYFKNGT